MEWREAVDRAISAVKIAEDAAGRESGIGLSYERAQTFAQISYAWSNIGMMLEAQESVEEELL